MMVLLSEITWTRGAATTVFASEVVKAVRMGVHCFLIHEVPGARLNDQEARHSCSFERFFMEDTTPKLLVKAKIYGEIAMNLAGHEWRNAGLIKTVQKLAKGGGERTPVDSEMQQQLDTQFPAKAERQRTRSLLRELSHLGQESRRASCSAPPKWSERSSSSNRQSDFTEFEQMNVEEFEQTNLTARERLNLKRAANKRVSRTPKPNETSDPMPLAQTGGLDRQAMMPTAPAHALPPEAPLPPPADFELEPMLDA
jgi:hypothetical protein